MERKVSDNPKVSILMPSLNVAGYIKDCIESVINQTLREIEIICIDAGSSDGTFEVLKEYAEKDDRIRVLEADHRSYGYQMNLGLENARGEFIGIVETDDTIEASMFQELYEIAKRKRVKIVRSNYYQYDELSEIAVYPFDNFPFVKMNGLYKPLDDHRFFTNRSSIWTGLYERRFIEENHIRFNETPGASYQDTSFLIQCLLLTDEMYITKKPYYFYNISNESSSVFDLNKVFCIRDEFDYIEQFMKERNITDQRALSFVSAAKFCKYLWNYKRLNREGKTLFLKEIQEVIEEEKKYDLLNKHYLDQGIYSELQSYSQSVPEETIDSSIDSKVESVSSLFMNYLDILEDRTISEEKRKKILNNLCEQINHRFKELSLEEKRRIRFNDVDDKKLFHSLIREDHESEEMKSSKVKGFIRCLSDNGFLYTFKRILFHFDLIEDNDPFASERPMIYKD